MKATDFQNTSRITALYVKRCKWSEGFSVSHKTSLKFGQHYMNMHMKPLDKGRGNS